MTVGLSKFLTYELIIRSQKHNGMTLSSFLYPIKFLKSIFFFRKETFLTLTSFVLIGFQANQTFILGYQLH